MSEHFAKLFQNNSEADSVGRIEGNLPNWLMSEVNQVIYNGPVGIWDHPNQTANHWFDGLSILTSFIIDGPGKEVKMKKRFLKSDAHEKAKANGKIIVTEYATAGASESGKGIMSKLVQSIIPGEMTDNCAANVYKLGGSLVASTETCLLRRIDSDTLATQEKIDMSGLVNIASARALIDPDTKDVFNIAGTFLTGLKYHFIKFPASPTQLTPKELLASSTIIGTINSRMTTCFSYYHSFGMTPKYLVMIEQPWVANSLKLATSQIKGKSFYQCLQWYPDSKNVFHVIDKATGKPVNKISYVSKSSFFFLNFINCFEEGENGNLIVDLVSYESPQILENMYLDKLRQGKFENDDKSAIHRYILPLGITDKVEGNLLNSADYPKTKASATFEKKTVILEPHPLMNERGCEHPSINRKFVGKKYVFAYVIGWLESVNKGPFANSVTKVNMDTGEILAWHAGDEFCHPAEAVFIPRTSTSGSASEAEDDGVVVASVTNVNPDQKDFLVFLEAQTMKEIGRAHFDESIPFASHTYLSKYDA